MKATDINLSRYWQLIKLESSGGCKGVSLHGPQSLVNEIHLQLSESDSEPALQNKLLDYQSDSNHNQQPRAELSLRCLVSHGIHGVCINLCNQFGEVGGFRKSDLFPIVLTDQGKPSSKQPISLGQEIIHSYDRQAATSLLGWATLRVKRHDPLNKFLVEHGIYRLTNWAILNDTEPYQLIDILGGFYSQSQVAVEHATYLLERYHQVYKAQRLKQREVSGKVTRCKMPTTEQLQAIQPEQAPHETLADLQALATSLRQYRIFMRGGPPPPNYVVTIPSYDDGSSEESSSSDNAISSSSHTNEEINFLNLYDQTNVATLQQAIAQVIQDRCKTLRSNRKTLFIEALKRFYCDAESMSSIAKTVEGFHENQTNVSRILRLSALRNDIRQIWLANLQTQVRELAEPNLTAEALEAFDQKLNVILSESIDSTILAEKSDSKNPDRSLKIIGKNLLSSSISQYLQGIS